MHVVFLTNEYPDNLSLHGGIGSFVQNLARNLTRCNFKVSIIGITKLDNVGVEIDKGVEIHRIAHSKAKFGRFIFNSYQIRKILDRIHKNIPIDIVEGSELSFAFLRKKTPFIKVIRMHGGHHFFSLELGTKINQWRAYQEKKSFSKADRFIAVSNYVGRKTQKYLTRKFSFKTIYNSVNTDKFKKRNYSKVEPNTLLFVGTICEKKGVRQLILAMDRIKEKYSDVKLYIVGREWYFNDGSSYLDYLKTFISDELKENIKIIGAVSHNKIPILIEKAEICVYPSHMEAMPIAWLEGLLMGKPVVASNIGPGNEAIINNITGLLVDPFSPNDIADKIILLLDNKEKSNCMGLAARDNVLEKFNDKDILKQNIEFYKSIV